MQDVMVDLETLGTSARAPIISIGAVYFDPQSKVLGSTFYIAVTRESNLKAGRVEDADTVMWWDRQSPEARKVLTDPNAIALPEALKLFGEFMSRETGVKLWGNGSDFDNVILIDAYAQCGIPAPWKFYNNRCYRTVKNLIKGQPLAVRRGTHHHALDDAITQAEHLVTLLAKIKG